MVIKRNKITYKRLHIPRKIILLIVLACIICNYTYNLYQYITILTIIENSEKEKEEFRELHIADTIIKEIKNYNLKEKTKVEFTRVLAVNMLLNHYHLDNTSKLIYEIDKIKGINVLENSKMYKDLYQKYEMIYNDILYFPIPKDLSMKASISYEDSWKKPRAYGGNRFHEGTDIMTSNNISGYFPILSVSDGVIEQKGWLEQGGYRVGVRSKSGIYFYYAHLDSYNDDINIGDNVNAGSVLGYMGNTGYSKIEGTSGNFDVHLHFGLYFDDDGTEMSVNPYWILKYLEENRVEF